MSASLAYVHMTDRKKKSSDYLCSGNQQETTVDLIVKGGVQVQARRAERQLGLFQVELVRNQTVQYVTSETLHK